MRRVLGKCADCYAPTTVSRCRECAAAHRAKNNARGAELRAACGLRAVMCSVCDGERHNRRTCPEREALKEGEAA